MITDRARRLATVNAFAAALLASTVLSSATFAQPVPVPPAAPPTPSADVAGAQPAAVPPAPAPSNPSAEIVVTGSRIRGVAPVGSTVQVLTTADIQKSGATTTTDLIQQVPQVFNLGVSETSRGQGGSAGSSNITMAAQSTCAALDPIRR